MKITVCDRETGRVLTAGDDAQGTRVAALLAAGHTRAQGEAPSALHRWDGEAWVEDAGLVAAAAAQAAAQAVADTDHVMARLAEDIFDALVAKGLLALDDLPAPARQKLEARKALRGA